MKTKAKKKFRITLAYTFETMADDVEDARRVAQSAIKSADSMGYAYTIHDIKEVA